MSSYEKAIKTLAKVHAADTKAIHKSMWNDDEDFRNEMKSEGYSSFKSYWDSCGGDAIEDTIQELADDIIDDIIKSALESV